MGLFRKQGRVSFFRVPSCSTDTQSCTGRGRLFLWPQPVPGTSACWESRQHHWERGTQHIPGRWHVCGPLVHTPAQNLVSLSGSRLARSFPAVPAMLVGEQSGQSCRSHSPWGRRMGVISAPTPIPKRHMKAGDVPHGRETCRHPASVLDSALPPAISPTRRRCCGFVLPSDMLGSCGSWEKWSLSDYPSVTMPLKGSRIQSPQKGVGNRSPHRCDEDWRLGILGTLELRARSSPGSSTSTLCS